MGDQVGVAVSGTLLYVPYKEFERIRLLAVGPVEKTALFASFCRINTLYMIARAGSGHIGSSFSSLDIMSWLHLNELRTPTDKDDTSPRDIFFSSKGHDAPGLYNTWIGLGKLDFDLIHQLRRLNGLPGHPDVSTPNVVTNTGSLGMGVSKAKGMIFANRLQKKSGNVFVLTGDGELQEGQFWESLVSAANHKLHELIVIIDHNKLQSDTLVSKVSDLGDLEAKLAAFGWHVSRCDGNNHEALSKTLAGTMSVTDKPKVIIADTIKGKGVSFMEHTSIDSDVEFYKFHSGAPTDDAYVKAAQELIDAANVKLTAVRSSALELETVTRPVAVQPENPQRLIQAYTNALLVQARKNPKIVALDADLILDTGLIPYQTEFPNRFVECGIAEQDMVSQAGAMALNGLVPITHSFACFLTSRASEQIYNNCTEHSKVLYVGSLAGILPAGPGHSHQAVRDIAAMSAMPGLVAIEPLCEKQVSEALDWMVDYHSGSSYMRLTSMPCPRHPEMERLDSIIEGRGHLLTSGRGLAVVVTNPVLVGHTLDAVAQIRERRGVHIRVIGTPWLNRIDTDWYSHSLDDAHSIVTVESHYREGGFGSFFISNLASSGVLGGRRVMVIGLDQVPPSGGNIEVLASLGLDTNGLVGRLTGLL